MLDIRRLLLCFSPSRNIAKAAPVPVLLSLTSPPTHLGCSPSPSPPARTSTQRVAADLLALFLSSWMKTHTVLKMRRLKIKTVTAPAEFKCQENTHTSETPPASLCFCPFRRPPISESHSLSLLCWRRGGYKKRLRPRTECAEPPGPRANDGSLSAAAAHSTPSPALRRLPAPGEGV